MIIINTFPTNSDKLRITDILIWTASLINYKKLGYSLKLFCEEKDIKFLNKYFLYDLYDEIDTKLFQKCPRLFEINIDKFWATRKFEALYYQLNILKESCIYSDTDIIMRAQLDISGDALVWSPEDWSIDNNIYIPWKRMSMPSGYKLPKYIEKTSDAYNCGILYFKNVSVFNEWYKQYYNFAINNPCELYDCIDINNNIFMCNAEQRILKAVLDYRKQNVKFVMPKKDKGWSVQGSHYFFYKISWKHINDINYKPREFVRGALNLTIKECIDIIHSVSEDVYNYWIGIPYLKDVELIDVTNKVFPILEYL